MTILCTIELFCILINLIFLTVDDTILRWDSTYFIMVVCEVGTYTIDKILTNLIIPGKTKFNTLILHITTIDDRTTCTSSSQDRSLYQPILSILDICIKCQRESLAEETSIQTYVILLRSFPLHILIRQTAGISTHIPTSSTTISTKVVIGIGCRYRSQILIALDIRITNLTPRKTKFQEIQPRST